MSKAFLVTFRFCILCAAIYFDKKNNAGSLMALLSNFCNSMKLNVRSNPDETLFISSYDPEWYDKYHGQ